MSLTKLGHTPGTQPRYADQGPAVEGDFPTTQGGGWRGGQVEEQPRQAFGVQPRGAVVDALQASIERDGMPKTSERELFDAYRGLREEVE